MVLDDARNRLAAKVENLEAKVRNVEATHRRLSRRRTFLVARQERLADDRGRKLTETDEGHS